METEYDILVENLCGLIDEAFDGVVLGNGIGLWEAQSLDNGDDDETRAKNRAKDEKEDWRRISYTDLNHCYSSPSYVDAAGFRFHLPAFLKAELRVELIVDFHFSLIPFKWRKYEPYSILNPKQRMAVRKFILFLIEHYPGRRDRPETETALVEYWTEESCQSVR